MSSSQDYPVSLPETEETVFPVSLPFDKPSPATPGLSPEVEQYVRQQKRKDVSLKAVLNRLRFQPGLTQEVLDTTVTQLYEAPLQTEPGFWKVSYDKITRKQSLALPKGRWITFLKEAGFYRYPSGKKDGFVFIRQHIVRRVELADLKQFLLNYLWKLPCEFYGKEVLPDEVAEHYRVWREEVSELCFEQAEELFRPATLQFLPLLDRPFLRDTATDAFFYFNNGWVQVTADGYWLRPYSELPGLVWIGQLQERNFTYRPLRLSFTSIKELITHDADFVRFLLRFKGGLNGDQLQRLIRTLGYLLHRCASRKNKPTCVSKTTTIGHVGLTSVNNRRTSIAKKGEDPES